MTEPPTAFLHPYASPAGREFVTIVRGEGAAVFDSDGRRYVDAMASLWYANVGHGRREIANAVAAQMEQLATYNTFDPFTNEPAERLCAELAALAPFARPRAFLTSSGSEAVESAIKLARLVHSLAGAPGRQLVVSREGGYHGVTYGGLSAQGIPGNQQGYGPLAPGFVHLPRHDVAAAERLFEERGREVAAFLTEPVQGASGVHPPAPGYLERIRELCDAHGAFLIFDEVITAFGRLGEWFGAQRFGVAPDLIAFAKGVTSGYLPLGGVLLARPLCDVLESNPRYVLRHGHTYSGHPTACAAALASLEILRREKLLARADPIGARLRSGLEPLLRAGVLAEIRGVGAIWGAELRPDTDAGAVRDAMRRRGVIVRAMHPRTIAFCPPLVIEDADLDLVVDALAGSIA